MRGWSWKRPFPGIGGLDAQFQCRPVPCGPGTDFWRSCRFIGAIFRALCALPGGIGRFLPGDICAIHCRLRHIGWEKCGHGLTSRPRESASEGFLNELSVLSRYPAGSAVALLEGCAGRLTGRVPTWRLPVDGHVAGLVTEGSEEACVMRVGHCSGEVLHGF